MVALTACGSFPGSSAYENGVKPHEPLPSTLQRGLWTHTRNALPYFNSVTNGWIDYSHNLVLVQLFSHALVASEFGHISALEEIKKDIKRIKKDGVK